MFLSAVGTKGACGGSGSCSNLNFLNSPVYPQGFPASAVNSPAPGVEPNEAVLCSTKFPGKPPEIPLNLNFFSVGLKKIALGSFLLPGRPPPDPLGLFSFSGELTGKAGEMNLLWLFAFLCQGFMPLQWPGLCASASLR